MAEAVLWNIFGLVIEELDEANKYQLQLRVQLGLLEGKSRAMLSVLDDIVSLDAPSAEKTRWAKETRDVVRSVEDMIDTCMTVSGEMGYGLYFKDKFLGFKLSRKIKRLMDRVDTQSKESKFLDKPEDKDQEGEAEREVTIMSFVITSLVSGNALIVVGSHFFTSILMLPIYIFPFSLPFLLLAGSRNNLEKTIFGLVEPVISGIPNRLRLREQILNARRECEGTLSRKESVISETNTIISSLLEQVNFILSQKFIFHPFAIREVEQVRQGIECIYDLLKDKEAVGDGELDEREKVWMEWVSEICLPANYHIASFKSKREQQIESRAKFKAPAFLSEDIVLWKKMNVIKSRIQFAYGRRWIYGMGESTTDLRPSTGFDLESIWKDVRLMRALSEDVSMEDQCLRVMVWLKQMEDLALKVTALNTRIQRSPEKMKGCLARPLLLVRELMLLPSIDEKVKEISGQFLIMSERKRTYDIGKLGGKRGQCSRVQDLRGTTADDDNNLEEAQPDSSQQFTETKRYVGEIEETSSMVHTTSERMRNFDIGKFEGETSRSSTVQEMQGTTTSTSDIIVQDDDNNLEEAQTGNLQQDTQTKRYKGRPFLINVFICYRRLPKVLLNALICSRPFTSSARDQVESILTELELIKAFLRDVKEIEKPDEKLKFWENEMRDIDHEAKIILGNFWDVRVEEKSIFNRIASTIKYLEAVDKVVEEISRIKNKIQRLTEIRLAYGIEHVEASNSMTQRRYLGKPAVIGFEDHVYEIKERLLIMANEKHRCLILIAGMGGSGKTALAKSIYNDNAVVDHFRTRACISISQKHSAKEILQDIREKLCVPQELKGKQSPEEELKQMLQNFLRKKRYLIILDNIPMSGVWDDVKDAFPDDANGSRIVITTRDLTVPPHAGSRIFQYKLQLRSSEESWTLFTKTLGVEEVPQEVKKVGRIIVMRCGGLPLEIVKMGKLLSKKVATCEEWSRVLDNLRQDKEESEISNREIMELPLELKLREDKKDKEPWSEISDKVSRELPPELKLREDKKHKGPWSEISDKVSRELPLELKLREDKKHKGPWSEISDKVSRELPIELKECLHYFLLFPEEFEIPVRRLIALWIAEGFLRLGRGGDSPEQVAERYLMELVDQNMVQVIEKKPNGRVRSCCLPVALRKLLSKAVEDNGSKGQVNTPSKSSSSLQQNRWIVDHYNNTCYKHIHVDKTDNATLQEHYKKSLSFMSFEDRLESQLGKEIGNFLDRCISYGCFLLLRVLDLECVFRPKLSKVLNKLTLLRYLGLRWTYLESLPSSICNLLKLQTLDVKHTYISTLPPSIWKMQRLRHLYLSESYRSRFEPRPRDASLTDLHTLWGAFVDEKSPVKGGLNKLNELRKLGVACRCMSKDSKQKDKMSRKLKAVADWIEQLKNLQSLRLKSHDEDNRPWDLHLESLLDHKNLSSVYLLGRLKTPSVISKFPQNLTELTLSASELTEDPMQKLNNLSKLRILQLFSESYVGEEMCCPENSFPELRVLKLWKLKKLRKWTVKNGALTRLRDLNIRSCANLLNFPDGLQHVRHSIEP